MKRVANILEEHGPMLSGDLAKQLVNKYGMNALAARKVISRAVAPVRKLNNINFDNNQKLYFLENQFGQERFLETAFAQMKTHSKAYYAFIQALLFHNGFLPVNQICAYTFSPIKPLKGHRPAKQIISDLCATKILTEYNEEILQINPNIMGLNYQKYRAIELAKKITSDHFSTWAKSMNLVAYGSGKQLSDSPEFLKFQWGFTAPSYICGIKNRNEGPTCFVIADILLGIDKTIKVENVDFYIKKIKILRQQKKVAPFIPILIVDNSIERPAFDALKAEGIVLGFVDVIFGTSYSEALKSLVHIFENASAIIAKNPDNYFKLIENLSVLEGNTINLKGDLFELAVGYYYSKIAPFFEINQIVLDNQSGKKKEIDVLVRMSNSESRIVECKGYKYPLDEEFVEKWLSENIPVIRSALLNQKHYPTQQLVFELWSTSGFDEKATELLIKHSNSTRKYTIRYYGRDEIIQIAKESNNANFQRILTTYYFNK